LTGTCYNFEMEEFFHRFCVARVCQHQLGFLVFTMAAFYAYVLTANLNTGPMKYTLQGQPSEWPVIIVWWTLGVINRPPCRVGLYIESMYTLDTVLHTQLQRMIYSLILLMCCNGITHYSLSLTSCSPVVTFYAYAFTAYFTGPVKYVASDYRLVDSGCH